MSGRRNTYSYVNANVANAKTSAIAKANANTLGGWGGGALK